MVSQQVIPQTRSLNQFQNGLEGIKRTDSWREGQLTVSQQSPPHTLTTQQHVCSYIIHSSQLPLSLKWFECRFGSNSTQWAREVKHLESPPLFAQELFWSLGAATGRTLARNFQTEKAERLTCSNRNRFSFGKVVALIQYIVSKKAESVNLEVILTTIHTYELVQK